MAEPTGTDLVRLLIADTHSDESKRLLDDTQIEVLEPAAERVAEDDELYDRHDH